MCRIRGAGALFLIAFLVPVMAAARGLVADTATILFHHSSAEVNPRIGDNARELEQMLSSLRLMNDSAAHSPAPRVTIVGTASPEGPEKLNSTLSRRRATALLHYLSARTIIPDSALISIEVSPWDWGAFRALAEADEALPARQTVVGILRDAVPTTGMCEITERLRRVDGGKAYAYMCDNMLPSLRSARMTVEYFLAEPTATEAAGVSPVRDSVVTDVPADTPSVAEVAQVGGQLMPDVTGPAAHPFYMALKTNMLYDVLAVPAVGAEFYVGGNISVGANWMYAWWSHDRRHRYWRIYGGDVALRYWLGRAATAKPLTGHHVGVYAGALTFDFEFGGTAYMGGRPGHSLWDRCIVNAGVEYGYSLPLARRLNIDFTLGVGYMGGLVEKFKPADGYYLWESTTRRRWFGPTKAEVSLVWLIGRGNTNATKGGER